MSVVGLRVVRDPEAAPAPDSINKALVVYSGFGRSPFPRARTADLTAAFGEAAGTDLKSRILALYEELRDPLPEPDRGSGRKSATQRAIEALAARHPELDEAGLKALVWVYSFGLR